MNNVDMSRHLYVVAKHNPCVNYQDNQLLKSAAKRLMEDQRENEALKQEVISLRAKVTELEYLLAEREGIQDDAILDASAPGEAAEDFFEDATDDYWDDFCS